MGKKNSNGAGEKSPEKKDAATLLRESWGRIAQYNAKIDQERWRLLGIYETSGLSPEECNEILGAVVFGRVEEAPDTPNEKLEVENGAKPRTPRPAPSDSGEPPQRKVKK